MYKNKAFTLHIHARTFTHMHNHNHTHMRAHTHTHTHTYTVHLCTCTLCVDTHLHSGMHIYTHAQAYTHLHSGIENLEYVMLEGDGGEGVVGEDVHHPLVQQRQQCLHRCDILHSLLRLLEPSTKGGYYQGWEIHVINISSTLECCSYPSCPTLGTVFCISYTAPDSAFTA